MTTAMQTEKFALDGAPDKPAVKCGFLDEHESQVISSSGDEYGTTPKEVAPTREELLTLRRVSDTIPLKAYTVAFIELVERLSYYGATQVFVNFVQYPRPGTSSGRAKNPTAQDAQPGVLGKGQRASTGLTTFNQFWVFLMPLFGAYIADTYTGRFRLIWISVFVGIAGHIILTASAIPSVIDRGSDGSLAAFVIGLIIMGIGTGGFKPNISPLVAEQIPHERIMVKLTKRGERVIVDPAVTLSRVYNWYYLFINIGAFTGQLTMTYAERYIGFWLAFLLPTICFLCTLPLLFICRKWYKHTKPEGSVLGPAFKLLFLATKGRWHLNPIRTYKHMTDDSFWNDVKPSKLGSARPQWMQFDDNWVAEVRRGFAACKVFLWYPLYWLTYNQINNNLTSQAGTMRLHGAPNDILSNLDPLALMFLIPLCDTAVYPFLRKMGINFSPIKRITAGFITGSMAMTWACVLQYYIYKWSPCGHHASRAGCGKAPILVWAQSGAWILIAISEILTMITSLEYAFSKAPKNMRSMVQAVALFTAAVSAAIGEAFVSLSADPLLVWNFGSMAVIAFVAGVLFYLTFRDLDKQEDELNALPSGHMHHDQAEEQESTVSADEARRSSASAVPLDDRAHH